MPGLYEEDEYDLAGFCVGMVDKKKIIDGSKIEEGDYIIGLPSSGLHSNGFSLVRKIIFDKMKLDLDKYIEELGMTLGEELLKPTRIYTRPLYELIEKFEIKGLSHITGGGFYENIPRVLPKGLTAHIKTNVIERPKIFDLLEKWGNIARDEMYGTFNMGIGMVLVVDKENLIKVSSYLEDIEEKFVVLGQVEPGDQGVVLWHQ